METQICPICGEAELQQESTGEWRCSHCEFRVDRDGFTCTACGAENPLSVTHCRVCGASLSTFRQVMDRHTGEQAPLWLKQVRAQASDLKQRAQEESVVREERFRQMDQRRMEIERLQMEEQRVREQQAIRGIGVGLLVIAVVLILLVILLRFV